MAVWSEVKLRKILAIKRFDSEYFSPEYLQIDNIFEKNKFSCRLGELLDLGNSNYGILPQSSDYITNNFSKKSIAFCRGVDVRKNGLNKQEWIRVPAKYAIKKAILQPNDLLILIKGKTIDEEDGVAWIASVDETTIFNGSIFRMRFKNLDPRFLYAFFRTNYFLKQKRRVIANATVEYNSLEQIKNYWVINPEQKEKDAISNLVDLYFQKLKLSQSLYTQAQELLEQELGLNKLKFEKPVGYEASFSEVVSNKRVDAEYSKPKYKSIIQHLKKFNLKKLKNIASLKSGYSFSSDKYTNTGIQIVRIQNISGTLIDLKRNPVFYPKKYEKELPQFIVKKNDIFMAMTGNTIGKCSLNTTERVLFLNQRVLSITSTSDDIKPEYLHLFLSNNIFQSFIERELVGGAQPNISMKFIGNQLIPILDSSIQTKISNFIIESHKAKRESQQLLEQAKSRVEQLIEEAVEKTEETNETD